MGLFSASSVRHSPLVVAVLGLLLLSFVPAKEVAADGSTGLPDTGNPSVLRVELTPSKTTYALGETIWALATVSNPTTWPVKVIFPSHCHWLFRVLDEGERIWYLGPKPRACTGAETNHTFLPSEIMVSNYSWNQLVEDGYEAPPGVYVLRFQRYSNDHLLMDEATVLIGEAPPEVSGQPTADVLVEVSEDTRAPTSSSSSVPLEPVLLASPFLTLGLAQAVPRLLNRLRIRRSLGIVGVRSPGRRSPGPRRPKSL